jgi:hypothetical protein
MAQAIKKTSLRKRIICIIERSRKRYQIQTKNADKVVE